MTVIEPQGKLHKEACPCLACESATEGKLEDKTICASK